MNEKSYGSAGKIIHVDLNKGHVVTEDSAEYVESFLGGRGVNWAILYNEIKTGADALGPENVLGVGTGLLVGTLAPAACRFSVDTKNLFTGGVGSSSGGGHWASELKFAGYDNIIIKGRAEKPTIIWIDDKRVELRNANRLWGETTWKTSEIIREELGDPDVQVICIGPAGENLVFGSCVVANNARTASRCGVGAIFGSKNLKAIAVRGSGTIQVADPNKFIETIDKFYEILVKDPIFKTLSTLGTNGYRDPSRPIPVKNCQETFSRELTEKVNGRVIVDNYSAGSLSCFSCPIHCSHWLQTKEGIAGEGFESNTAIGWGSRIGGYCLPAITRLHFACNQLGLDIDATSVEISWAMECYERGILTKEDTDALDLSWGNYEAVTELVRRIAYRKGRFANALAEGVKRASERIGRGSEKYAMHVKGQDLFEDARSGLGWALGLATTLRGGTHTKGAPLAEFAKMNSETAERIYGASTAGEPWVYEGKGRLVVYTERTNAVLDSLGLCLFVSSWMSPALLGPDECAELVNAATGWKLSGKDLLTFGERIYNVEKAFNVREAGFARKDDMLPTRFFEPIPTGPLEGNRIERVKFETMLDEYYSEHNWDVETGLQTRDCLTNLGLQSIRDELARTGKLANKLSI
jgi:aldehyde:ferredoxin oxidoreductase